ncbi:hypothetical protein A3I18_01445 [Candidatus Campbellbacteria bacterium RIFCSPLOWO2_02_FULL_35_11]|uniref:DUF5671 domain-containing protein n=2 Tax=Candidatus Campbelliibacteriota TaxID=1752727 RepID=A0A1F5EQE4_9BACT|nr:MAG: hypothetical protein A3E89_00100 [Candidatus Campbellbacteria bacterium RIFCSPHIGHO2_12_FULL_35_10]OGD70789.1 MAG: hypothetical protein A3I18_01445 [Candidatus Campbellbacteria bacterium RIFCSPLOWO2_02_FULL_35_11]
MHPQLYLTKMEAKYYRVLSIIWTSGFLLGIILIISSLAFQLIFKKDFIELFFTGGGIIILDFVTTGIIQILWHVKKNKIKTLYGL